ncbi:MAG TPA: tetratricopeptide repeat-containing glycosyltransferase family protein [Casimicrobiaceae bacterium]|nr:tetratricopeptide repeat-containing glycosyltransferase family protein [Casimicrobiaceae bacterium]
METLSVPQAMQHALLACQRGEWAHAERLCRLVLDVQADHYEALYVLGIIAGRAGRAQDAADLMARALSVNPASPDAHYNRGVALGELKRTSEALDSYDRAIALKPGYADAHYNRGNALYELERHSEALRAYERALAIEPGYAEAHNNRGIVLNHLGSHAEALESYQQAIALRPDYASAWNHRGVALLELNRLEEALASHDRAIAINPDYVEAFSNRGNVLIDLDRAAEALSCLERAVALKPDHAEAWYNRGNALRELHRHGEAVASYERALALRPDYAAAHWNLADCCLLLGDFARGWEEYEWRWKLPQREQRRRDFVQPPWRRGQPAAGKTVLLHSELGLGDTLLFCRYAGEVAKLGAKVVLEVQPSLLTLLADLEGVTEILPRGAPLPAFDSHCPLLSLPLAFKTDLSNIPAVMPYVHSDPARVAAWRERLGPKTRPRVGLVWSGSAALKNDKRSMALAEMLPLLANVRVEWISLQKDVPAADMGLLASRADLRHVGDELNDFAATAAVVELMDLVVTVDTSVANLAGAMGKPVWILLPFNPHDWRWMLDREDSPWYPTARLFRQPAPGDWAGVVRRVAEELARRFDKVH